MINCKWALDDEGSLNVKAGNKHAQLNISTGTDKKKM